ncbi:MAG: hypothetical protein GXN92_02105 [Candidatus Micrarchaeota archaeon]|nr:hypothetical protein [Candidatus Micrarchaeota archaeon]
MEKVLKDFPITEYEAKEYMSLEEDFSYNVKLAIAHFEVVDERAPYVKEALQKLGLSEESVCKITDVMPNNVDLVRLILSYYGDEADPEEVLKIVMSKK